MKSVRIQPIGENSLGIDVVCDCGRNGLTNTLTLESSFKHTVLLNSQHTPQFVLRCKECGNEYLVVSQRDHIHITDHKSG